MKISQKRAIWYNYQEKKRKMASNLVAELTNKGISVIVSKYPEITIRRCNKILKGLEV